MLRQHFVYIGLNKIVLKYKKFKGKRYTYTGSPLSYYFPPALPREYLVGIHHA